MNLTRLFTRYLIHCKTVRISAYSSTREHSNKRSGTRLKTESETGERRFFLLSPHITPHSPYGRVRLARFARVRLLSHALPISLLILRKKPTVCSLGILGKTNDFQVCSVRFLDSLSLCRTKQRQDNFQNTLVMDSERFSCVPQFQNLSS